MEIIAIAKPNRRYRWYDCLRTVHLEVRLVNGRIYFYEVDDTKDRCIAKVKVKELFIENGRVANRPFLIRENSKFYQYVK